MKKTLLGILTLEGLVMVLWLGFLSCSQHLNREAVRPSEDLYTPSTTGEIHLLKVDPGAAENLMLKSFENHQNQVFKYVAAGQEGIIQLGLGDKMQSTLWIPKHALPKDALVEIGIEPDFYIDHDMFTYQFAPHQTAFKKPVTFIASYAIADLNGVDEDKLGVYYFNEETRLWEFVGGLVDKANKTITVELYHFSRYAIAHS